MRKWKRKKICQILHLSVTVFSQIFLTDDLTLHAFSTYIFRSIFNLKNNVLNLSLKNTESYSFEFMFLL